MPKAKFDWDMYIKLSACRSLTQLAQRSFSVNLNFVDQKGWLRGAPAGRFFNPANRLSALITSSDEGFKAKRDTAFQLASEVAKIRLPKKTTTKLGTALVGVPVVIHEVYYGYIYTDDFFTEEDLPEQKTRFESYLSRHFSEVPDVKEQIDHIPVLSSSEVDYLLDIMEMITEFFSSEMLTEKKKIKEEKTGSRLSIKGFKNKHIVGRSTEIRDLLSLLSRIASSDATVLITGESGVGKELVAKTLHENSSRKSNDFVGINCGAFNENLLESELFGHMKGAFTGADNNREGYFAKADRGTLFLDEIGETSLSTQVKMLRFLQESTFLPVGSSKEQSSNVRVITATNRDLKQMLKKGDFRQDFYYRVKVIQVTVPSLRERKADIPLLIEFFVKKHSTSDSKVEFGSEILAILTDYHWPGNVRQLENEIKRICVLLGDENKVTVDLLSEELVQSSKKNKQLFQIDDRLKQAIEEREKKMIVDGLDKFEGNITKLAKSLGMSKTILTNRMKKYDIT